MAAMPRVLVSTFQLRFDSSDDAEPQMHFCRLVTVMGITEMKFTDQPSCVNGSRDQASHRERSFEVSFFQEMRLDKAAAAGSHG